MSTNTEILDFYSAILVGTNAICNYKNIKDNWSCCVIIGRNKSFR